MTMQQRKYFIEIAKELNITKAAEKLYVSQQNLSLYLKKLEEYYDCTLEEFCRRESGMTMH